jgi:hypothetical protein
MECTFNEDSNQSRAWICCMPQSNTAYKTFTGDTKTLRSSAIGEILESPRAKSMRFEIACEHFAGSLDADKVTYVNSKSS